MQLLYTTGLRRTELAHVRVENIDLAGQTLAVEHGKRRRRELPIPDGMVPLLERIIGRARGDYLMPGTTEKRRSDAVARVFTRWQRKLVVPAGFRET